jgi:hypothetical protein
MSCPECVGALPLLIGWKPVAVSPVRHGELFHCNNCSAWYEAIGEDRGPREVQLDIVRTFYPDALSEGPRSLAEQYGISELVIQVVDGLRMSGEEVWAWTLEEADRNGSAALHSAIRNLLAASPQWTMPTRETAIIIDVVLSRYA